jgi:hypothetical protein
MGIFSYSGWLVVSRLYVLPTWIVCAWKVHPTAGGMQ